MSKSFLKEACIQTVQEARIAQKLGADRLEFCSRLDLDGLTPDFELVREASAFLKIPIMVMIRPREGDFQYSAQEFEQMKSEIQEFKKLKVQGFVFGITKEKAADIERTRILAELCAPYAVCFHKAIDVVEDPIKTVTDLSAIPEITRILTSGQADTAKNGIPILKEMIKAADGNLSIMPAGKVRASNIEELHEQLGAIEYHGRSIMMHY